MFVDETFGGEKMRVDISPRLIKLPRCFWLIVYILEVNSQFIHSKKKKYVKYIGNNGHFLRFLSPISSNQLTMAITIDIHSGNISCEKKRKY